jgi:hypothetical protein
MDTKAVVTLRKDEKDTNFLHLGYQLFGEYWYVCSFHADNLIDLSGDSDTSWWGGLQPSEEIEVVFSLTPKKVRKLK